MKNNSLLSEGELRNIVARVIKKKLILEVEELEAKEAEESKSDSKEKPALSQEKKEKAPTINKNPDISDLKLALKTGGTDNLAKMESNTAQRAGEAVGAGGVAAAVAFGIGSIGAAGSTAALMATAPVSVPLLALGAGLYYVFNDDAVVGSTAVTEALDTTLYKRVAEAFKQIYSKFQSSKDPKIKANASFFNPDVALKGGILTPEEQSAIAVEIYDATQGGTFGLGVGTDEDAVKAALQKCKSFLGVSQVSLRHAKKYAGGIIDDGNLLKVFRGEFDTDDFDTYVSSVIESLPFIFIGNKSYTKSEFLNWIEETKSIVDNLGKEIEEVEPKIGEADDKVGNYIKECQALMNDYCSEKNLDYTPIKPDGQWGPRTNRLWLKPYLPHVLENHPEISKVSVEITGSGRWSDISAQLMGDFPGYTPGERGCYNFCKDALEGGASRGKGPGGKDKPIKYYGMGGSGGGKKPRRKEPSPIEREGEGDEKSNFVAIPSGDGRLDYRNIVIDIDIAGNRKMNSLESLPGAQSGDSLEFAYDFLGNFRSKKLVLKNPETFQLNIYVNKKGKVEVKNAKGSRLFKNSNIRAFKSVFKRYFDSLDTKKLKTLTSKETPLVMKVKLDKGVYKATTKRLHESMMKRKNLKQIIF